MSSNRIFDVQLTQDPQFPGFLDIIFTEQQLVSAQEFAQLGWYVLSLGQNQHTYLYQFRDPRDNNSREPLIKKHDSYISRIHAFAYNTLFPGDLFLNSLETKPTPNKERICEIQFEDKESAEKAWHCLNKMQNSLAEKDIIAESINGTTIYKIYINDIGKFKLDFRKKWLSNAYHYQALEDIQKNCELLIAQVKQAVNNFSGMSDTVTAINKILKNGQLPDYEKCVQIVMIIDARGRSSKKMSTAVQKFLQEMNSKITAKQLDTIVKTASQIPNPLWGDYKPLSSHVHSKPIASTATTTSSAYLEAPTAALLQEQLDKENAIRQQQLLLTTAYLAQQQEQLQQAREQQLILQTLLLQQQLHLQTTIQTNQPQDIMNVAVIEEEKTPSDSDSEEAETVIIVPNENDDGDLEESALLPSSSSSTSSSSTTKTTLSSLQSSSSSSTPSSSQITTTNNQIDKYKPLNVEDLQKEMNELNNRRQNLAIKIEQCSHNLYHLTHGQNVPGETQNSLNTTKTKLEKEYIDAKELLTQLKILLEEKQKHKIDVPVSSTPSFHDQAFAPKPTASPAAPSASSKSGGIYIPFSTSTKTPVSSSSQSLLSSFSTSSQITTTNNQIDKYKRLNVEDLQKEINKLQNLKENSFFAIQTCSHNLYFLTIGRNVPGETQDSLNTKKIKLEKEHKDATELLTQLKKLLEEKQKPTTEPQDPSNTSTHTPPVIKKS